MIKRFLYRVLCGFFLGLGGFAPGFSGNILAIILGVYHDVVQIASNPFKNFKKNVIFCIPLAIGVAVSAVFFVFTFRFLFDRYEKATYFLFVGLICGNIPEIWAEIKKEAFSLKNTLIGAVCFALALILGVISVNSGNTSATNELSTGFFTMGIAGIFTGAVLFIPGMSVSAVLVIIGVYEDLIAISHEIMSFNFIHFWYFAVFATTALIGVIAASNGIKYVFKKYPAVANTAVFGFMIGSLMSVLIKGFSLEKGNSGWGIILLFLFIGLIISFLFVILSKYIRVSNDEAPEKLEN